MEVIPKNKVDIENELLVTAGWDSKVHIQRQSK
jgi:hypothetical protein